MARAPDRVLPRHRKRYLEIRTNEYSKEHAKYSGSFQTLWCLGGIAMEKMWRGRFSVVLALTALLLVPTGFAAGPTGKIVGTVTDSSGNAIPGAKVSITNQGTNEVRTDTSEGSGNFTFAVVPIGNYTIKVEASGFQTYQQKDIVLQVDQNITVNAPLQVGSATEVVEVNGGQQNIDLVDATVSNVVDRQRIEDLPLNGRD